MHSLLLLYQSIAKIRKFFAEENFLEVIVPPMVNAPVVDTHVHPLKLTNGKYLHTSPEFPMKYLLALLKRDIFTITYVFRDDPFSPIHRQQFIMLEWYRYHAHYHKIIDDLQRISNLFIGDKIVVKSMADLFFEFLEIDLCQYLTLDAIKQLVKDNFSSIYQDDLSWEDYFYLIFLNEIEKKLGKYKLLVIDKYPAQLASLATLNEQDNRLADRFEFFIDGIEIANCFNELSDPQENEKRIAQNLSDKKRIYHYTLPIPQLLLKAAQLNFKDCCGVALGVERMINSIYQVNSFFDEEL